MSCGVSSASAVGPLSDEKWAVVWSAAFVPKVRGLDDLAAFIRKVRMSWRLGMSNARPGANVVDEHVFMFVLELEIRKALRLQYPISLVTISAHESPGSASAGLSDADLLLRVVSRSIRGADLIGLVPHRPMALRALLAGAYIDDVGPVMERTESRGSWGRAEGGAPLGGVRQRASGASSVASPAVDRRESGSRGRGRSVRGAVRTARSRPHGR
jgi:hypothetical protein